MGFGVSGSTAVIFLGVLIATGTLYTAAAGSAEQVSDARDTEQEELLDRRNTAIDVTEVVYNTSSSNDTLFITVINDGSTTLSVDDTSLLVDNEYVVPDSTAVEGDTETDVWAPDQSLVFETTNSSAPSRVKAVAENGVAASNTTVEEVS